MGGGGFLGTPAAYHSVVGGLGPQRIPGCRLLVQLPLAFHLQLQQSLHGQALLGQASPEWGRGARCRGHGDIRCLLLL